MKYFVNLFALLLLLSSCGKEKENVNNDFDDFDFYQIKTINGIDRNAKTKLDIQVYESIKGKKFVNQVKQYKNEKIDSLNSHFYTLEFIKTEPNNYKGNIQLTYESKKILEIEFKVITTIAEKPKSLTFKSNNTNRISFKFSNTDSASPLKGVLCIKLETEVLVNGKKEKGYYNEYMFVDNNKTTDNLFIKKYKKII
jgi:hypothetical protein